MFTENSSHFLLRGIKAVERQHLWVPQLTHHYSNPLVHHWGRGIEAGGVLPDIQGRPGKEKETYIWNHFTPKPHKMWLLRRQNYRLKYHPTSHMAHATPTETSKVAGVLQGDRTAELQVPASPVTYTMASLTFLTCKTPGLDYTESSTSWGKSGIMTSRRLNTQHPLPDSQVTLSQQPFRTTTFSITMLPRASWGYPGEQRTGNCSIPDAESKRNAEIHKAGGWCTPVILGYTVCLEPA